MLGVTMYIYAIIGMSCFGGKIYIGNAMLVNTTFDSNNYYPNNFNDFGSSLVTLFELLVVNNVSRMIIYFKFSAHTLK